MIEKLRAENEVLRDEIRFLEKQSRFLWVALAFTACGFTWCLGMLLR